MVIITFEFLNFNVWEWFLQSSVLERTESNLSKINWLRGVILFNPIVLVLWGRFTLCHTPIRLISAFRDQISILIVVCVTMWSRGSHHCWIWFLTLWSSSCSISSLAIFLFSVTSKWPIWSCHSLNFCLNSLNSPSDYMYCFFSFFSSSSQNSSSDWTIETRSLKAFSLFWYSLTSDSTAFLASLSSILYVVIPFIFQRSYQSFVSISPVLVTFFHSY